MAAPRTLLAGSIHWHNTRSYDCNGITFVFFQRNILIAFVFEFYDYVMTSIKSSFFNNSLTYFIVFFVTLTYIILSKC